MPLVERKFLVALCPVCKKPVGYTGEGGFNVFSTRKEAREAFSSEWVDEGETMEMRIAYCCETKNAEGKRTCADIYRHRYCAKRPCGYCRGKKAAGKGD